MLEQSFKWEGRTLYLIAVGCPLFAIHPIAGLAMAAVIVILVIVMDTAFSVLVTMLFVYPINEILEILKEGEGSAQRAAEYKRLQKTMWHTLFGSTLAVVSSTVLYVNMVLCFTVPGPFFSIPWLHIFVFGVNLDSIFNDIGMWFVSGMFEEVYVYLIRAGTSSQKKSYPSPHRSVAPMYDCPPAAGRVNGDDVFSSEDLVVKRGGNENSLEQAAAASVPPIAIPSLRILSDSLENTSSVSSGNSSSMQATSQFMA
jgi:hypothetical protein